MSIARVVAPAQKMLNYIWNSFRESRVESSVHHKDDKRSSSYHNETQKSYRMPPPKQELPLHIVDVAKSIQETE